MAGKSDCPLAGVLALQGDFAKHADRLRTEQFDVRLVKSPGQLEGLDCLAIPGGESTTLLKLLEPDFEEKLTGMVRNGLPVLATCAGVILLAAEVSNPSQRSLGLLDVTVQRNGYGRQLDSSIQTLKIKTPSSGKSSDGQEENGEIEAVFIRAPVITRTGENVTVLASRGDAPALVQAGKIIAATFHPELSDKSGGVYDLLRSLVT